MRISVYNQRTHIRALSFDLQRAKLIVIIVSPYLAEKNIERWSPVLKELIDRGVIVDVVVDLPKHYYGKHPVQQKEEDNEVLRKCVAMLEAIGVHVSLVPNVHTKLVIIDYRLLWDGSLNFLSSNPISDISERANRYDDVIHTMAAYAYHNLERCELCETKRRKESDGLFFVSEKAINTIASQPVNTSTKRPTPEWRSTGKLSYSLDNSDLIEKSKGERFLPSNLSSWLQHKRKELGFRASEMAAAIKVNKSSFLSLESGRSTPSIATMVRFVNQLGWRVIIVPHPLVPLIDYIVRSYHMSDVATLVPKPKPLRKSLGRPPKRSTGGADSDLSKSETTTISETTDGNSKLEQQLSESTFEVPKKGTADEVYPPLPGSAGTHTNSL